MEATKHIGKANQKQGKEFEEAFSAFMIDKLGYLKADRLNAVHSHGNARGIELDILGKKQSNVGRKITRLSQTLLFLSVCITAFPFIFWHLKVSLNEVFVVPGTSMVMVLISAYILKLVDKYSAEYTWVECKSGKEKTTYDEVDLMVSKYNQHMKCSGDLRRNFRYKIFVSASGYIDTALKHALDNDIICYICEGGEFRIA